MILVDTSIWIDHIRSPDRTLEDLLVDDRVVIHPYIIGEIMLGSIRSRVQVLEALDRLPTSPVAFHSEVLTFIDRHRLEGSGIGYVDTHLLVSACLSEARLWTRDRRLGAAADRVGVAADELR